MKCDELKYERLDDAFETYPDSTLVIRKQYVDAAIAELKAENDRLKDTQRWRKVSEELPNDGEPGNVDTVLVAVEIRTIDNVQYRLETAFFMDGKFWMTQKKRSTFDKEDFSGYGYFIQKVTHWMPLPKTPEEK